MGVLIVIGMVPLIIFSFVFINLAQSRNISQQISELQVRGNVISNRIAGSGYFTGKDRNEVDEELAHASDVSNGRWKSVV